MATTTISDYRVVMIDPEGEGGQDTVLSDVFYNYADAREHITKRREYIAQMVADGSIFGVCVREDKTQAKFVAVVNLPRRLKEVGAYMSFGSRILREGDHYVIVGVPVPHAGYLAGRLASGLLGGSTHDTLEDAISTAENVAGLVYGA